MSTDQPERNRKSESSDGAIGERELSPQERIDATIWRVIRDLALVALLQGTQKRSFDLSIEQQNDLLEPLIPTLVGAQGMLRECGQQYLLLGLRQVHQQLHGQPGIDHEMLDEAVEFHTKQRSPDEDEPFILER